MFQARGGAGREDSNRRVTMVTHILTIVFLFTADRGRRKRLVYNSEYATL
jgi:hypothetical protein